MTRCPKSRLALVLFLMGSLPRAAHAYLDPGSGSLLLQAALAGLLGAILAVRIYFHKLRAFLWRLLGRERPR